jgi:hypothetical protein
MMTRTARRQKYTAQLRRALGVAQPCGNPFHPAHAAEERDNGRGKSGSGQSPNKALAQSPQGCAVAG